MFKALKIISGFFFFFCTELEKKVSDERGRIQNRRCKRGGMEGEDGKGMKTEA